MQKFQSNNEREKNLKSGPWIYLFQKLKSQLQMLKKPNKKNTTSSANKQITS